MPRSCWLRKSRAERPCCQHVRHTDISTDCARAPTQVRLPPPDLKQGDAEADCQFRTPVGGVHTGHTQEGEELLAVVPQVLRQPLVGRVTLGGKITSASSLSSRPRETAKP
jgi:hypothetical protein